MAMRFARFITIFAVIPLGSIYSAAAQPAVQTELKTIFDNSPQIILSFSAPDLDRPEYARCRFVEELRRRGGALRFTLDGAAGARRIAHEGRVRGGGPITIAGNRVQFSAEWGTWGGMVCTYALQHAAGKLTGTMACSGHGSSGCPAQALGMRINVSMDY